MRYCCHDDADAPLMQRAACCHAIDAAAELLRRR